MPQVYSTATLGLRINAQQFNDTLSNTSRVAQAELDKMKLSADAFGDRWSHLNDGIKDTKRIISGILISQGFYALFGALTTGVTEIAKFSASMETAAISMEYFVEGANKAAKASAFLREINTFAAETPFNTEQAISMSKYMQAVGISMNATKSVLGVITDAAAATGATDENLQRIVFALGQMKTKGRIANEEIRQLANANIPIYDILQEELGLTGAQISNIGKYWVEADDAIVAIMNGLEKRYDGAAERVSNTVTGMLDTLGDNSKIISQQAFSGIYDAASNVLTQVRDLTDRYREVVTEQGSMGLFNTIITDIDATGEVGASIIATIGNVRQLGSAIGDLYSAAQPLIGLFGKSIYASINVATIGLTSFARIADGVVSGMQKLGVTTGTTAQVLSSLFITYKAATWMGALGQGAMSAAYSLYQTASAASAILPAALRANAGVSVLTAGLAGLISYGLAAAGIFSMLNNASAGLDVSTSSANLYPDDYSGAMSEYETEMAAYNEAIAKYQEDFNSPYTAISDGSEQAVSGLSDVAKASKKASGSVKRDWTAAFDEVYTIPDEAGGGGGADASASVPDLGSFLTLPTIKLPSIDDLMPKMPEFDWNKVYEGSPFDSEIFSKDFWSTMLPIVIAGGAVKLGSIMAKNAKLDADKATKFSTKLTDVLYNDVNTNKAILKSLESNFNETERLLRNGYERLRDPRVVGAERTALESNNERLVAIGEQQLRKLNEMRDALAIEPVTSRTLENTTQHNVLVKLFNKVNMLEEEQRKLLDEAYVMTAEGTISRKTVENLQRTLARDFGKYIGTYGNDTGIENLLKSLDVNILSVSGAFEKLYAGLDTIADLVKEPIIKNLELAEKTYKQVQTAVDFLSAAPIADKSFLKSLSIKIDALGTAIKADSAFAAKTELLEVIVGIQKNAQALKEMGEDLSNVGSILNDTEILVRKGLAEAQSEAARSRLIAKYSDAETMAEATRRQAQLNNNKAFTELVEGPIGRQLGGIMGNLSAIKTAGTENLRQFAAGMNALNGVHKKVTDLLASKELKSVESFRPILQIIATHTATLTSETGSLDMDLAKLSDMISVGIQEIADNKSAEFIAIDAWRKTYEKATEAGATEINKSVKKGLEVVAAAKSSYSGTAGNVGNVGRGITPEQILGDRIMAKFKQSLFDKNGLRKLQDVILDSLKDITADIRKIAIAENWPEAKLGKVPFSTSNRVQDIITDNRQHITKEYNTYYATKAITVDGTSETAVEIAARKIGADVKDIPAELADVLGTGTRTAATEQMAKLVAANKDTANKLDFIVKGGIFKYHPAMTGGDVGPASEGLSSLGTSIISALRDDLTEEFAEGFRDYNDTIINLIPRQVGIEAEGGFRRIIAARLAAIGENVYMASTYISKDMKMIAQLDALSGTSAKDVIPMDLKLLSAEKLKTMIALVQGYSEQTDLVYKLTAEGVRRLSLDARAYVLQATQQGMITGKNTVRLAVGDRSSTIDPFVKNNVLSKIDITAENGLNKFKSVVREGVIEAFSDDNAMARLSKSATIFEWKILKEDRELINRLSNAFIDFKTSLTKRYIDHYISEDGLTKADVADILKPRLTTGQPLADSYYRYIGNNYDFEGKGVPTAVKEVVNEQTPMLRSGDYTNAAVARQRLLNVADSIYDAVKHASKATKEAGEDIIAVIPALDAGSAYKEVKGSADTLLRAVNSIHDFVDVYKGYDLSALTQYKDKLKQIRVLAALNTPSSAIINPKAPIEKQITFKKLIDQTASMARNLEKIYGVTEKKFSTSLTQMAAQGTVGSLEANPFDLMDILELNDFVKTTKAGFKEERLAIESAVADLVSAEKHSANAAYNLAQAVTKPADKVENVLTKEIAKSLEGAATAEQLAAVKLTFAADETMKAASESASAARATARAADTLNNASKAYAHTANTDTLLNLFKSTYFNPEMMYTVYRGNGAGNADSVIQRSGKQLQDIQATGRAGWETATIKDQLGRLAYAPVEDFGAELPNFMGSVDNLVKELSKSGLNGNEILDIMTESTDAFYDSVKKAAVQVDLTDSISEMFKEADYTIDRGTISRAVKESMDSIVGVYQGTVDKAKVADEILSNLRNAGVEDIFDDANLAKAFSDDLAKSIDGVFTKNDALLKSVAGEALGNELEAALSKTGALDIDKVLKAYSSIGENFIATLNDGGLILSKKAASAVMKNLSNVLTDGAIGIPADDIAKQLRSAASELGAKVIRKNADVINMAIAVTADDITSDVADELLKMAPELEVSDDVLNAAEDVLKRSADDLTSSTAKNVAKGISGIAGHVANVGLNVLGTAFEAINASKMKKASNESITSALEELSKTDTDIAGALKIIQDNNASVADILGKELVNAKDKAVKTDAAIAAGGLAAEYGTIAAAGSGMLGTGLTAAAVSNPVGWIVGGITAALSAAYTWGGGKTAINQDTDAYMAALENDTFYKNAKEQGMTDAQARAIADELQNIKGNEIRQSSSKFDLGYSKAEETKYKYGSLAAAKFLTGDSEEAIQNRILRSKQALGYTEAGTVDYTDSYYRTQDGYKILEEYQKELAKTGKDIQLYQTENLKSEKDLLDAIFLQGDYTSDVAKSRLSMMSEEELDFYASTKEYGSAVDVYRNIEDFVGMLNEMGTINESYKELLDSGKLSYIVQAANEFVTQYQSSVGNLLSIMEGLNGDNISVDKVAVWNSSDNDKKDDNAGQTLYDTYANFDKELAQKLAEQYGIEINASIKEVVTGTGDVLKELYTATTVDIAKAAKNATGWTLDIPDNITLDSASLSASDVEVLAAAGIQINSDGTITFMKAMNENITGTERQADMTSSDISKTLLDALSAYGINVTGGEDSSNVKFDTGKVSSSMTGAMFQTSIDAATEVSSAQSTALESLGQILDSGFIQITNKAVLNGEMTVSQYLASMGTAIDTLSPEIQSELARIDEVIAQGGVASAASIATWADGIVVPSPIDEEDLTSEIEAAFAAIGVTFTTEGDEFVMVVNRLGDQLKDGTTLIPAEMWDGLNESVKMNLKALGVTWETEAGYTKVNISNTLGSLVDVDTVDPMIATAMQALGLAFTEESGVITGVVDQWGKAIKDGMYTLPTYLKDVLTPEVKTAMESLGIVISETEEGTILDMNGIMSKGIGSLVSLFTEQPDFWNQIPEAIKQTMIAAGYVTADGMLQINAKTLTGLQLIGDDWVGFWQNMPDDAKQAFSKAGINTQEGCFMISKYLDESSIPDGINYLIKKFDELPPEMQDAITKTGEAINENGYVVYNATAAMVGSMENAILSGKSDVVGAAQTMAQEVASAISAALGSLNLLEAAHSAVNKGIFKNGRSTGSFKKLYGVSGDYSYADIYDSKGEKDGFYVYNNTTHQGKEFDALTDFKAFAEGGMTGATPILAGEYGTEMAILPDGRIEMLGGSRGVLADMPEGTRILNAEDTQEILKYTGPIDKIQNYGTGVKAYADGNATVTVDATAKSFEETVLDQLALLVQYATPVETTPDGTETLSWLAVNLNQAIRGAVAAITEFLSADSSTDADILLAFKSEMLSKLDTVKTEIATMSDELSSAINSINVGSDYDRTTLKNTLSASSKEIEDAAAIIAAAKAEYEAATTDEEKAAAHNKAEGARGSLGYAGGDDGSQNIGGAQEVVDAVNTLVATLKTGVSGSTATVNGTAYITDGGAYDPVTGLGLKPITGSASGSLVTRDALYRAGEFGLNEAIVPLEKPSIMKKVGSTIADYIPSKEESVVLNVSLTAENIANIAAAIYGPLLREKPAFVENFDQAIRGAVAALSELSVEQAQTQNAGLDNMSKAIVDKLGNVSTDLSSIITSSASSIADAVNSIDMSSMQKMEMQNSRDGATGGTSWQDVVAEAKAEYAAATTAEGKAAAHTKAEAARATVGLTGGDDGSVLSQIKGSARGSLVNKDSLYRAGEFGLNEAIIPLERPGIMKQVGAAIASFMPSDYNSELAYARTLPNAGVSAPQQVSAYDQQAQMMSMVDSMAQRVLETVLPAMSYSNDDESKTPIYVGTLVADDAGLKQLEKKLYVIRKSEEARRS